MLGLLSAAVAALAVAAGGWPAAVDTDAMWVVVSGLGLSVAAMVVHWGRRADADGSNIKQSNAARLSAAGSKLARVAPAWAWWFCQALVFYTIVGALICSILPMAETDLYKAVIDGDGHTVASLLQQGADPDHGNRKAAPLVGRFIFDETHSSAPWRRATPRSWRRC